MNVLTILNKESTNKTDYSLEDIGLLKDVFEDMLYGISQFCIPGIYDYRAGTGLCSMVYHVCTGFHFKNKNLESCSKDVTVKGRVLMLDVVKSSRYYSGDYAYFIKGGQSLYERIEHDAWEYGLNTNESGFYTGKQLEYRMKTIRRCINRCNRLIRRYSR